MPESLVVPLTAVVIVAAFFAIAVALVGTLTWVLFSIPGSPWPQLCRSNTISARTFTLTVVALAYLVIPGLLAWQAGMAFSGWVS